jgi:hypothetical protein
VKFHVLLLLHHHHHLLLLLLVLGHQDRNCLFSFLGVNATFLTNTMIMYISLTFVSYMKQQTKNEIHKFVQSAGMLYSYNATSKTESFLKNKMLRRITFFVQISTGN